MFTRNLSPSLGRTKVPLLGDFAPTNRGRAHSVSTETAPFARCHQRNRSQRPAGLSHGDAILSRADDHVWRRLCASRRSGSSIVSTYVSAVIGPRIVKKLERVVGV